MEWIVVHARGTCGVAVRILRLSASRGVLSALCCFLDSCPSQMAWPRDHAGLGCAAVSALDRRGLGKLPCCAAAPRYGKQHLIVLLQTEDAAVTGPTVATTTLSFAVAPTGWQAFRSRDVSTPMHPHDDNACTYIAHLSIPGRPGHAGCIRKIPGATPPLTPRPKRRDTYQYTSPNTKPSGRPRQHPHAPRPPRQCLVVVGQELGAGVCPADTGQAAHGEASSKLRPPADKGSGQVGA